MKIILQRVSSAAVRVEGQVTGEIESGLLLLVGFGAEDTEEKLKPMAQKISELRIFPNEQGRFDKSLLDIGAGVLLVPQFTLFGDTSKGRRPEFFGALEPARAEPLFRQFTSCFRDLGIANVGTGIFGAHMEVSLVNDGPVTLQLES